MDNGQPNAQPTQSGAQPTQSGSQPQNGQLQMIAQRLLQAAQQMIYQKNSVQQILQIVKQAQDPVQGIVQATMLVLHHLLHQVKGIDPRVVYLAAPRVALMIAELCVKAKIIPDDASIMRKVMPALQEAVAQEVGKQPQGQPQPQQPQPGPMAQKPAGILANAMGG